MNHSISRIRLCVSGRIPSTVNLEHYRQTLGNRIRRHENIDCQAIFRDTLRSGCKALIVRCIQRLWQRLVARWADVGRVVEYVGIEVVHRFYRDGLLPSERACGVDGVSV